ncbi:MAG: DJ-1/PfpI family protein [Myxococcales bacterium]|nr:DJ-1/PfpI family protein [Myxococcales bacterium]
MGNVIKRRELLDLASACAAALAASKLSGCALDTSADPASTQDQPDGLAQALQPPGKHVGLLVYPYMTMLDLVGPQTCFLGLGMTMHLVWRSLAPIPTENGFSILPTSTFRRCPEDLEILFVPGSTVGTAAVIRDADAMEFVRSRGSRAKFVTSVCTGSMILGAAGLLRGYRATSHWLARDLLPIVEAEPVDERYVVDRNRITGGGVTSGIDFGLRLLAQLNGQEAAEAMQLVLEYAPDPPFNAGHPSTAPAAAVGGASELLV